VGEKVGSEWHQLKRCDALGWWLVGLKPRERMAVGGKKRTPWIPSAHKARGKKAREGKRGCQSSPN